MTNDSSHSRRWLWLSIALLVLPALALLLVHAWLGWEGERLWQQAQARLKAEGETLDFMALVPKPVPDEDNFFAIEPLKDIALVVDGDVENGEPGARRARFKALKLADEEGYQPSRPADDLGIHYGIRWDANLWAAYYRQNKKLNMPTDSGNPAKDLLNVCASHHALIAELHLGIIREQSRMTPALEARQLPANICYLPFAFFECENLSYFLNLRSHAALVSGDSYLAVMDARVLLRLAEAFSYEPSLNHGFFGIEQASAGVELTWALLAAARHDKQAIEQISHDLKKLDMSRLAFSALRGEMIYYNNNAERLASDDFDFHPSISMGSAPSDYAGKLNHYTIQNLWLMNSRAVSRGNAGSCVTVILNYYLAPLRKNGLTGLVAGRERYCKDVDAGRVNKGVMAVLSRMQPLWISGFCEKCLQTQARLHQARLACALERYFLQHQRYPETLNDLVPAFIDKVLLDPCDDKPMRYARTPAGRYKLWSLGFDGDDDGGKVIASPNDDPTYPKLNARDYPGDWVWSYERLVPLSEP